MSNLNSGLIPRLNRIPGRAYLLTATLIFAAANSITSRLVEIGSHSLIKGRNPISFCNVLFVGNLCALAILAVVYRHQLSLSAFKQLSRKDISGLIAVAILSGALAPALVFSALETTAVNNVILIGRIEPPLVLTLSVLLLGARVNFWVVAGALISFLGVALTVFLQPSDASTMQMMGWQIGRGELMVAGGAIAASIASVISQVTLQQVPLGLFNVVRTAIGTVVFFVAAILLFGADHFADVFSPTIWKWMILYSAVIVVGGQLCWFAGLKNTQASEIALATSFNPVAGVLAAYLVLGEVPTAAQYIGGIVILIGIALNQVGITQRSLQEVPQLTPLQRDIEKEMEMGFRGI
ncbi:MAG: DMT family transporter [Leptolyngbyaceae cyanobacterium RM1_1_2]|nr:DMT family transporter [Leptolyngbyaceae cyanobacterium RM1_1_2]